MRDLKKIEFYSNYLKVQPSQIVVVTRKTYKPESETYSFILFQRHVGLLELGLTVIV